MGGCICQLVLSSTGNLLSLPLCLDVTASRMERSNEPRLKHVDNGGPLRVTVAGQCSPCKNDSFQDAISRGR